MRRRLIPRPCCEPAPRLRAVQAPKRDCTTARAKPANGATHSSRSHFAPLLSHPQGGSARTARSSKKKKVQGGGTGYGGSVGERTSKAALALQAAAKSNAEQYDKAMSAALDRVAELLPQAKAAGGLSAAAGATLRCGGAVPVLHAVLRVGSLMAIGERPAVYMAALRLVGCEGRAGAWLRVAPARAAGGGAARLPLQDSRRWKQNSQNVECHLNVPRPLPLSLCTRPCNLRRAMAEHPELLIAVNSPGFAALPVPPAQASPAAAAEAAAAAGPAGEDDEEEPPEPASTSVVDDVLECVFLSLGPLCLLTALPPLSLLPQALLRGRLHCPPRLTNFPPLVSASGSRARRRL